MNLFKRKKRLNDVYEDDLDMTDEEHEEKRKKDARKKIIIWVVGIAVTLTTLGGIIGGYISHTKVAKQQAIEQKRLTQEELDKKNELTKETIETRRKKQQEMEEKQKIAQKEALEEAKKQARDEMEKDYNEKLEKEKKSLTV